MQLSARIAHLTTRYGSDPAAWQHETAALAALEASDPKAAIERFHALKRRLVEFRRAQLFRDLRAFPFVTDVPTGGTRGHPMKELEADVREATRALAHARSIAASLAQEREALAALRRRSTAPNAPVNSARWDAPAALAALAEHAEARRRAAMREARIERRYAEAERRAARVQWRKVALPDAASPIEALDAALATVEVELDAAEELDEAHRVAVAPLKAPEVGAFRAESRRALDREARALAEVGDLAGLARLATRAEALRKETAKLASEAARSRRAGRAPPERERRAGDTMDGYG